MLQPRLCRHATPAHTQGAATAWQPHRRPHTCRRSTVRLPSAATQETAQEAAPQEYRWRQAWYPIVPVGYLYKDRPTPFQLLGLNLVIWFDPSQETWSVLDDECSHRLAPLSEGYIQPDGSLMCSYHGWEFKRDGSCSKIPQMDAKANAGARNNPRACVGSYPVQEAWNLIWVWPEPGADAWLRASTTEANVPRPVKERPESLKYFSSEKAWSMRETPLDYELLVENILDLSHVPFSHHSVAGNRADASPSSMTQVGSTTCDGGFVMSTSAADEGAKRRGFESGRLYFIPPNTVHYEIRQSGSTTYLTSFTTPCAPGKSRYFSRLYSDRTQATPGLLGKLLMQVPPWLIHLSTHNIVDADMLLAAGQQRALGARGMTRDLEKAFFCPAAADRAVMTFYRWLNNFSGGRIKYVQRSLQAGQGSGAEAQPSHPSGAPSREQLLDRWTQHTRHCRFCHEGIKFLERARAVALAVAGTAAALAAWVAAKSSPLAAISCCLKQIAGAVTCALGGVLKQGTPPPPSVTEAPGALGGWWSILWAGVALVALKAFQLASQTEEKFYRGDYTFHDKHLHNN